MGDSQGGIECDYYQQGRKWIAPQSGAVQEHFAIEQDDRHCQQASKPTEDQLCDQARKQCRKQRHKHLERPGGVKKLQTQGVIGGSEGRVLAEGLVFVGNEIDGLERGSGIRLPELALGKSASLESDGEAIRVALAVGVIGTEGAEGHAPQGHKGCSGKKQAENQGLAHR